MNELQRIPFQTIQGETTSLEDFKGKVVLIVNVASKCGYTPQYEGLEKIYRKYKEKGFTILGFPANNFGQQEPGSNEEIIQFCKTKYDVTFPMMAKISVKGTDIHPLYKYLTENTPFAGEIKWNFNKFLIDQEGNVVARFDSKVRPEDKELITEIEKLFK
ncbi:MAG: glutathione peroxidase [bacterium]|nr:glutathione peroxidase [bacterium]